jgi:GAF domain-containing protein
LAIELLSFRVGGQRFKDFKEDLVKSKARSQQWELWNKCIKDYETEGGGLKNGLKTHWPDNLLSVFKDQFIENALKTDLDLIWAHVIKAMQIICGFERVRLYLINGRTDNELRLHKWTPNHGKRKPPNILQIGENQGIGSDTLSTHEPFLTHDVSEVKRQFANRIKIKGPYAAIPLFLENAPLGLITADVSPTYTDKKLAIHLEDFNDFEVHFKEFAITVTRLIEIRVIFEIQKHKIEQLDVIKKFEKLIESEIETDRTLSSLIQYSAELVHADGGHLKLFNEKEQRLKWVAQYGDDTAPPDLKTKPVEIGFSNHVYTTKKSLMLGDASRDPIMKKHIEYCKNYNQTDYLKRLKKRKSVLVVPLITHEHDIKGVLALHSKKINMFRDIDLRNLEELVHSVIHAVTKVLEIEQQRKFAQQREKLLRSIQDALSKTENLQAMLDIIKNSIINSEVFSDIKNICLSTKDYQSGALVPQAFNCTKSGENCSGCISQKPILHQAIKEKRMISGGKVLVQPILLNEEPQGALFLEFHRENILSENEKKLLDVIQNGAAILVSTAQKHLSKIKQVRTLYTSGKLQKGQDYREWFKEIMQNVMEILGRSNRNFHLVLLENENGQEKLVVKQSDDIYIGEQKIQVANKAMNMKMPLDGSLCGLAIKEKTCFVIDDIRANQALPDGNPDKLPFLPYNEEKEIRSEMVFPLIVKKGEEEKAIGALAIDSLIPNDFRHLEKEFIEAITQYLAVTIHNQQLHEKTSHLQDELSRSDRRVELDLMMDSFFHEIKDPMQEIKSCLNVLALQQPGIKNKKEFKKARKLADEILTTYKESVKEKPDFLHQEKQVPVKDLIERSLDTVDRTRGLDINLSHNYLHEDISIHCKPVFIEKAFRAIINNALKYSKGIDFADRYLNITTQYISPNRELSICFESSSTEQIPEEMLAEEIFKRKTRGTTQHQGEGLGLWVAKTSVVNMHEGRIKAENVPDKNAVKFTITLPALRK